MYANTYIPNQASKDAPKNIDISSISQINHLKAGIISSYGRLRTYNEFPPTNIP